MARSKKSANQDVKVGRLDHLTAEYLLTLALGPTGTRTAQTVRKVKDTAGNYVKDENGKIKTEVVKESTVTISFSKAHYQIWLLLLSSDKALTAAQIANTLGLMTQNINAPIQDLLALGYIEEDRIEGRNRFLRAVTALTIAEKEKAAIESGGEIPDPNQTSLF